jgi:uncharacterized protein YjiS (DUF1127 family)
MLLINVKSESALLYGLKKRVALYIQRSRTRRQLHKLDDAVLKDIGLTRQQAEQEARLYFWQGDDILLADDSLCIEL